MSKEQGLIESPEEIVPIFDKFIKKGNSKALILTPISTDISKYIEVLSSGGYKVCEIKGENFTIKNFDENIDIWFGEIPKIDEFMTLFGDKLTVFLVNVDYDIWIEKAKELGLQNLVEINKSQFSIMYDELYAQARKGQAFRDTVGTMTTLILHLRIKEKRQIQAQPRVEDKYIEKEEKGNIEGEELKNNKEIV